MGFFLAPDHSTACNFSKCSISQNNLGTTSATHQEFCNSGKIPEGVEKMMAWCYVQYFVFACSSVNFSYIQFNPFACHVAKYPHNAFWHKRTTACICIWIVRKDYFSREDRGNWT